MVSKCMCKCCRQREDTDLLKTNLLESLNKNAVTDTMRLEWMIESSRLIKKSPCLFSDAILYRMDHSVDIFKTTREAIDAAMEADKNGKR